MLLLIFGKQKSEPRGAEDAGSGAPRQTGGQVCLAQCGDHQPRSKQRRRVELRRGKVCGQLRWGVGTGAGVPSM